MFKFTPISCGVFYIITTVSFIFPLIAVADVVFVAPPREKLEKGKQVYEPLVYELSKALGEKVVYKHPTNWTEYAKDMRAGKYDIVFDGPHFAAWRIEHKGHLPVARLSGYLQFYVIVNKDDKQISSMKGLLGKSFCGLASPNLGTMAAFNLYSNPIIMPDIQIVKGGMKNVMVSFLKGECRAAVVWDKLYKNLTSEQKSTIKIIAKSKKLPNQSFTVSPRLGLKKRRILKQFFKSDRGIKAADNVLKRYSKKANYFISTSKREYVGLSEMLEGVVFGW